MAEQVRVVVDAMGGDNAPAEPVRAAVEAVTERQDIKVILTGKQEVIDKELAKYSGYPKNQIQVVNASQVIETAEPPVFRDFNAVPTKSISGHIADSHRSAPLTLSQSERYIIFYTVDS